MSAAPERPLCLLLGALGGQGGGVLIDWIDQAAEIAGYRAQATSIPGVAQRTGATTYYLEVFPVHATAADPIFSLYPSPGQVDLVATLEPIEAGRALERGFITDNTTVISASNRLFSTAEKVVAGDGRADLPAVIDALRGAARRLVLLDGSQAGQALNAVLLGAIAAANLLPIPIDAYRRAIESRGVAVAANLAGFDTGLTIGTGTDRLPDDDDQLDPVPPGLQDRVETYPEGLRPLIGHALARLVDYQDLRYARRYLERLDTVVAADSPAHGHRLTDVVIRRLAAWMSFEDVIRVAQLKTRPGRLARVRQEIGAEEHDLVELRDYLKPGSAELRAILPRFLGGRVAVPEGPPPARSAGFSLRLPTSSPVGFALLRGLALLRPLRPLSGGYHHEQQAIDRWLEAVRGTIDTDYDLACDLARLALVARGYGRVRLRGMRQLDGVLSDWQRQLSERPAAAATAVRSALQAAENDPDGELAPS